MGGAKLTLRLFNFVRSLSDHLHQYMIKISALLARLLYCYQLWLRRATCTERSRSVQGPANCSALLILIISLVSCNCSDESSPYSEVLSKQPFAPLTDSIKSQPKNDDLSFRRAVLLNGNNFPVPALADFQKAWSIHKDQKYAVMIAGLWMEKRADSAIAFLNRALKELPHSYSLRLMLARSYDAANKTIDGLKVCDELLKTYPNNTEVLLLQSGLLEKRGDTTRSIIPLEKAYRIAPGNVEIGLRLAYKYAETKNPKVLALCDSLIKRDSLKLY